mgnify:CR=1 FL=1
MRIEPEQAKRDYVEAWSDYTKALDEMARLKRLLENAKDTFKRIALADGPQEITLKGLGDTAPNLRELCARLVASRKDTFALAGKAADALRGK